MYNMSLHIIYVFIWSVFACQLFYSIKSLTFTPKQRVLTFTYSVNLMFQ